MEMENSRRSFDRSRELGLKRPRLDEKMVSRNSNARSFVQRPAESASLRARELEGSSDTSIQELASQYRTALAELTFNSKPIITNLTIIAGESLHAAKAIASIICSNILEVPTDQKLPSLYLLDSIVKNIGRDYIKYFAARLPEVFCKAYRQVDPAVHPGMRHLFGTWRSVFPPQSLQMIEKELGFPPAVSNSASGTSKPGSQSQRPPQSIHVNPKYLEARQHQQSSKVNGTITDINASHENSPDETVISERTNLNPARQRADPRLKMPLNIQHPPRDAGTASFQQNSSEFGAYDYDTELARHSASRIRRSSDRVTEQVLDRASWYGSGSSITETSSQRTNSDIKLGHTNFLASRSANSDANLQNAHNLVSGRNSIEMDRSWKNSEEEEYTWDDVNSISTNYGVNHKSRRDPRLTDDSERRDTHSPVLKPQIHEIRSSVDREASGAALLSEQRNRIAFGSRAPSTGPYATLGSGSPGSGQARSGHSDGYPASLSGLSTNLNYMGRTSFPLPNNLKFATSAMSGSSGSVVQQRYSAEVASPSGQSLMLQRPSLPYRSKHSIEEPSQAQALPHVDARTTQIPGKSNFEFHSQFPQKLSMPAKTVTQIVHRGSPQDLQPLNLQGSSYINSSSHQRHQDSSLQKLQCDPLQYDPSAPSHKPLLPQASTVEKPSTIEKSSSGPSSHPAPEMLGQLSSSLLTAVMDSGILGKNSVTGSIPKDSFRNAVALPPQASSRPSLPNGAPPTQLEVKVALATPVNPLSHESMSVSSAQGQTERPPLSRGPPPSVLGSALEQTANVLNATSSPMSSLLSTLVAKGLISASKTESAAQTQIIADLHNQIQETVTTPMVSSTLPVTTAITPSSTDEQFFLSKPTAENPVTLHVSSLVDFKSHIGFEFTPDVIRASHPVVINELLHDLPHQCSMCGLRVKFKESFDRHMECHTLRKAVSGSRKWYVNYLDWIKEKVCTCEATDVKEVSDKELENGGELMLPADENHCVCVLCGELFEDLYNQKMDRWMFKEAVYLTLSPHSVIASLTGEKGPIVHANCISESSLRDLGLANSVKVEKDA